MKEQGQVFSLFWSWSGIIITLNSISQLWMDGLVDCYYILHRTDSYMDCYIEFRYSTQYLSYFLRTLPVLYSWLTTWVML